MEWEEYPFPMKFKMCSENQVIDSRLTIARKMPHSAMRWMLFEGVIWSGKSIRFR